MNSIELTALAITLFAGLATGIGSALAFFTKKTNKSFLSFSLGFSGGVMVYVSFVDIMPKAQAQLALTLPDNLATWYTVMAFFGGILYTTTKNAFISGGRFRNKQDSLFIFLISIPITGYITFLVQNFWLNITEPLLKGRS